MANTQHKDIAVGDSHDSVGDSNSTTKVTANDDNVTITIDSTDIVKITDAIVTLLNSGIITSDTDTDLAITPNGTGDLILDGLKWPQADGTSGYVLTTDAAGQLSWSTKAGAGIDSVADDTTPQLGGNLDMNSKNIEGVTPTEIGYVSGVTSAIQTQLGTKLEDDSTDTLTNKTITAVGNTITPYIETLTGTDTLIAAECYGAVYYVNSTGVITLPAVAVGMNLTVITIGAILVSINPNGSEIICLDGTDLGAGYEIDNTSTAGDIAVLTYYAAGKWHASTNTWTDGS